MPSEDANGPRIREATPADIDTIAEMIEGLADYEKLRHECDVSRERLKEHLFGERPFAEVIISEQAERAIGFSLYFFTFSTFRCAPSLYLEDLFVVPEARRIGTGSALLKRLAQIALERGCERFEWAVLDWNQMAIDFYEKMGATVMQDWRTCRLDGDALIQVASA